MRSAFCSSDAHFRKEIREFPGDAFGYRVVCGESRLEILGTIDRSRMRFPGQAIDIVVQLIQKLTRFCVDVASFTQFAIQFCQ